MARWLDLTLPPSAHPATGVVYSKAMPVILTGVRGLTRFRYVGNLASRTDCNTAQVGVGVSNPFARSKNLMVQWFR